MISANTPLMEAGVDSLGATELQRGLSEHLSTEFEATLLFDHPSIDSIVSCYTASGATLEGDAGASASTAGIALTGPLILDEVPVELAQAVEGVAVISYNRPEKGNSFDAAVSRGLVCMLGVLDRDAATSSVVVTGRGSFFCAAAKFDEMLGPAHPSELAS